MGEVVQMPGAAKVAPVQGKAPDWYRAPAIFVPLALLTVTAFGVLSLAL